MLYLIKSNEYLKIGYAKNINERMKVYRTCNPSFQLLDTAKGSLLDEGLLHDECKKWQYRTEWFEYDEEVINIWNRYKQKSISESIPKQCSEELKKIINEFNSLSDSTRNMLVANIPHLKKDKNNFYYYEY